MAWRVLIGLTLAGAVWMYGVYWAANSGLDGPCLGTSPFAEDIREGSGISSDWEWLPPRERCIEERMDGTIREAVYPGPVTLIVAGLALLLPIVAGWPGRFAERRRRIGELGGS
jgi:hypothetical protein